MPKYELTIYPNSFVTVPPYKKKQVFICMECWLYLAALVETDPDPWKFFLVFYKELAKEHNHKLVIADLKVSAKEAKKAEKLAEQDKALLLEARKEHRRVWERQYRWNKRRAQGKRILKFYGKGQLPFTPKSREERRRILQRIIEEGKKSKGKEEV